MINVPYSLQNLKVKRASKRVVDHLFRSKLGSACISRGQFHGFVLWKIYVSMFEFGSP